MDHQRFVRNIGICKDTLLLTVRNQDVSEIVYSLVKLDYPTELILGKSQIYTDNQCNNNLEYFLCKIIYNISILQNNKMCKKYHTIFGKIFLIFFRYGGSV